MMCRYSSPIGLLQGSFKDSFGVYTKESVLFFIFYLCITTWRLRDPACVGLQPWVVYGSSILKRARVCRVQTLMLALCFRV